jgi:hypothetical protein
MPFSLPTTKAYVEFIGREKTRAHLQCIYCKVIQSNQDMCVCGYMVANPNSTLLLENLSLFLKLRNICKRIGAILFISFFFLGGHLSTHCFRYLRHLSIFSNSFFMNNFCIAPYIFSAIKLLRDSNKNVEHLFGV